MKNILFLITTQTKDGPGNVLINLINQLDNGKYKIYVAYLYENKKAKENIFDHITIDVEFINLEMKSVLNGWLDFGVITRIRSLIKEKKIDILHMHLHRAIVFGTLAAQNVVTIATIHNMEPHQNPKTVLDFIVKKLENFALKRVKYITTVSNGVKNNLVKYYKGLDPENIWVVYNGIDNLNYKMDYSYSLRKRYKLSENCLILACIGRLEQQKGIEYLINALEIINTKANIDYILFIIGDGTYKNRLNTLISTKNLCDNVIMTGYLNNVMDVLREVDLLIMPSLFEGLGMVLLEAMSQGVCCLGTDAGGIPEVLGDIVPIINKGDSLMLAEILLIYMSDKKLRTNAGFALKERFMQMFTAEIMAKNYQYLYDSES